MPQNYPGVVTLAISGSARIYLYKGVIDMRKGFEGLQAMLEESVSNDLATGSYFVFINRRRDRMKVLYWDGDGLVIWYKRLEKGTFSWKEIDKSQLNRRDFFMLLEGITPRRLQSRYKIA